MTIAAQMNTRTENGNHDTSTLGFKNSAGGSFCLPLLAQYTDGTPFDFATVWTAESVLKKKVTDSTIVAAFVIQSDASGSLQLALSPADTLALTDNCYVYDVKLTRVSDGAVEYLVKGKAVIERTVTRSDDVTHTVSYWAPGYF